MSGSPCRAALLLAALFISPVCDAQSGGSFQVGGSDAPGPGTNAPGRESNYLNTGWVSATGAGTAPKRVFTGFVDAPGKMWVRLHFGIITLSGERGDENASYVVLTSELDGASQTLWIEDLEDWCMSSAYFNGDRVRVEVFVSPQSGPSFVQVNGLEVGEPGWLDRSICGPSDGRVASADPRVGRLLPAQCTAWLVSDMANGLLTAGHCSVGPRTVVQFNVPASTVGGSMVHPDPEDQYPIDPASKQTGTGGLGNDWMFVGAHPNHATGRTMLAAQGSSMRLATSNPPVDGRQVAVTGYGQVSQPVPLQYNYIQTTDTGRLDGATSYVIKHQVDTTGGDSGAPIIDQTTGLAIGIHTNGGCNSDGYNRGTAATRATLRAAMAAPLGAAAWTDPVGITYSQGRPAQVSPSGGDRMRVRVSASETRTPMTGTAVLHVFNGTSWVATPMERLNGENYRGTFPPLQACMNKVQYFVTVQNTLGEINASPAGGGVYIAEVAQPSQTLDEFSFEESLDWEIYEGQGLRTGAWEVAVPPSVGRLGPKTDFDGSGSCLLTGAASREDVDGGRTIVTSPGVRTCPGTDVYLSMAVWHASTTPDDEGMSIEVSTNGGNSWTPIDLVERTNEWEMRVYRLADYTTVRSTVRIRFVTSDSDSDPCAPEGGIVESAVDRLRVYEPQCGASTGAEGGIGNQEADPTGYIHRLTNGSPEADLNGDGVADIFDLLEYLQQLDNNCP